MLKRKVDLPHFSEKLESKGQDLVYGFINRFVRAFFRFKKQKGELSAASATFFAIMSFSPLLLLTMVAYNSLVGDSSIAYERIFSVLKSNFPNLAPWILKSIKKIIKSQMSGGGQFSLWGFLILLYASLGFASTLNYGLYKMAGKEPRGGKIFEDIRSFFSVCLGGGFLIGFIYLTREYHQITNHDSFFRKVIVFGVKHNILQAIGALSFFTIYFKWLAPIRVRYLDAFSGALSFISLFAMGKSFYWVYLKLAKKEMIQTYGNFYTLTEAVLWVYFVNCAFFLSATVAYSFVKKRASGEKVQVESPPEFKQSA